MMSYGDVYDLLAKYGTRAMVEAFADGWSRFPESYAAIRLANDVEARSKFYMGRDDDLSLRLLEASTTIRNRAWA